MTNLKVDIIYYKTSSDFELEFNLTGCCRMRLFKDKIDDRKDFVSALARDVTRSRVILIVSDLYGDKNGAETVSAAIGYKYVPLDKTAHRIKSDEEIYIPNGSLPLVTKSGQFGGCIIECGKQSIIIVSSDRALRHEVMHSYIHQYVFDINQVEQYNERLRHENSNNPVIDNSNILTAARKEFTSELPSVQSEIIAKTESDGVSVTAPEGVVLPEDITDENTEKETAEIFEETKNSESGASTVFYEESEEHAEAETMVCEEFRESDSAEEIFSSLGDTDGFEIPREVLSELESKKDTKVNRRIMRRRKGGNIALLIIAILMLLCFGLLAYYLVYLPIISGNMPNNLSQILEAIL